MTEFLRAIAMTVGMMLYAAFWLLVCLIYISVHIAVVYGAMYALSKLAGRIRAGHARRRAGRPLRG